MTLLIFDNMQTQNRALSDNQFFEFDARYDTLMKKIVVCKSAVLGLVLGIGIPDLDCVLGLAIWITIF